MKKRIILLICIFLHFRRAHFQFYRHDVPDDDPQRFVREPSHREKYQSSWRSEDDQDQEQMRALDSEQDQDEELWSRENRECPTSICSAENANALRFEKPWGKKPTMMKKLIKDDKDAHKMAMKYEDEDEDDGDDEDDDDDDDDDDEDEDDEYLSDGEQEAFMARMTCLMKSLDTHTRAISRNLKILQTRLNKAQDRSNQGSITCRKPDFSAHPKGKWFENPEQDQRDPEQCGPTKAINNRQDNLYSALSARSPIRSENLQDSERQESPEAPQRSQNLQDPQEPQRPETLQESSEKSQSSQDPQSPQSSQGPQSPQSPSSNADNHLMISPLLKLINSPAALQSKQDSSPYWIPAPISTRSEAMNLDDMASTFNKRSKDSQRERYEEYETRLRRLMANRDAIEKNVMKVMTPPRRMPRG